MDIEQKAITLGENKKLLRKHLKSTRMCLTSQTRSEFGEGIFDFENKRLVGDNGLTLVWRVRKYPDLPISYKNQQTSMGYVGIQN